jgi:hypothetical protein
MRLFDRRAMAFTVESMALRILVFTGKKIESWYSVPLEARMVREGLIAKAEYVGSIMSVALKENEIPRRGAVTAIPSSGSSVQMVSLPGVKKSKLKEMVGRELRRTMPGAEERDYIYWQLLPEKRFQKKQQQVYSLTVPKGNISTLVEACQAGGVTLRGLELKPFALLRAIGCDSGIIVHAEMDNTEIVIVDKGFPALFRAVPVKDVEAGPEAAAMGLMRELPFTIDYFYRTTPDCELSHDAPVYLSGELALDPNLAMQITETTGREVVGAEPAVECPLNFPSAQFLTSVGLMLRDNW